MARFSLILTKIWFSIERKWFQGASPNINRDMTVFSPQPLKKWFFFVTPRKSQNVKMRNFCNGFYKMMMSAFKKITASLIWGNSFAVKNIHRRSKVSIQAAYENMSTVSHKTWLIWNDWMTIMLHGYELLKITYLGIFSIKVCFCKSMLRITNNQSNQIGTKSLILSSVLSLTTTVLK